MRVFLDANILFSAANPNSHTRLLIELLLASQIECLSNVYGVEEARRNLALVFPQFLSDLEALLLRITMVESLVAKVEITIESKDLPILYGALAGQATHLLTYDESDFGELMRQPFKGLKVLTPRMLLEELRPMGIV